MKLIKSKKLPFGFYQLQKSADRKAKIRDAPISTEEEIDRVLKVIKERKNRRDAIQVHF